MSVVSKLALPEPSGTQLGNWQATMRYGVDIIRAVQFECDNLCEIDRVDAPQAAKWLSGVERRIPTITAGAIVSVVPLYDFIYRLVHAQAPDRHFINRLYLRAFRAHLQRPRSVNREALRAIIDRKVNIERDRDFLGAPARWLHSPTTHVQ